ncbi:amino acid adenylation domain-containing protein [Nocardia sp. NBC_00508]|uniref:amino acid adenylation domain-containing protein n=1 Tax=Nocardia sp. NBC_00508 TaxID=2975992 RepID=UPI002E802BAC|nr:amino acid adenylation domain-containing protein [Nocardia sp. NBC_00508]WUD68712.1 amino acid adenylation domain-containing protein [Nocardia sp. NBC_00508]
MSDEILERRKRLLQQRLRERQLATENPERIRRSGEPATLSPAQQRMWFIQTFEPDDTTLNVCVGYRLDGPLDTARLRAAFDAVVARHEILRTTYHVDGDGDPYQVAHADLALAWQQHDLTDLSEDSRGRRLEVLARREFARPFDLTDECPLRVTLARTGPAEHVLVLTIHHIAWDDGSWPVFFTELNAAYRGDVLPEIRSQYVDVSLAEGAAYDAADLAYWRARLTPLPERLELPGAPSTIGATRNADKCVLPLPQELLDRVAVVGRDHSATPFMVLLAAFQALIHRYTAATDFLVAVPVTDRRGRDAEALIGYFGNTLPLRAELDPAETFAGLVDATRDAAIDAFAHQGVGVERVVREVSPDRIAGRDGLAHLMQLSFSVRGGANGFDLADVGSTELSLRSAVAQETLGLMVVLDEAGARVEATYLVDELDRSVVAQLLRHYLQLLASAIRDPRQPVRAIDLLGAADQAEIIAASRGPLVDAPATTLVELVQRQASATPDRIAVVSDAVELTYAALHRQANRLAHWFIRRGVGAEQLIALRLANSVEFIVASLAVLKSGAAYLPIDPAYPADRIDYLLSDAQPTLSFDAAGIAAAMDEASALPETDPTDADRTSPLRPSNIAYVIYTSGSTGRPKGVPVPHDAIADHLVNFAADWDTSRQERVLQATSVSFDASLSDIFLPLIGGATIVVPKPNAFHDIPYVTELIARHGITVLQMVPSLLATFLLLPEANDWRALRHVPVGGEALPGEVADRFTAQFDAELRNHYGPTEAVVCSTSMPVEGPQGTRIVPIGFPNRNVYVYLLDASMRLVPPGVIGEIYLGGCQLARGYLDRPALTAERFVADPFVTGGRLYRTGDLARRTANGEIEFIGRADEQVKVRGFRIELGEVEAAVADHPGVAQCVAIVTEHERLGPILAAYLVPAPGTDIDIQQVRARVVGILPEHMVPAAFAVIDEVPLSAHGKLDRRALPAPVLTLTRRYRKPESPTEIRVAALYQKLFDADRVGADDSFFELGGHSLLAARLVAMVREAFGIDIDVRVPFDTPTVAGLAAHLIARYRDQCGGNLDETVPGVQPAADNAAVPTKRERPERVPLSYSQRALWLRRRLEGPFGWENFRFALRFDGELDIAALRQALGDVIARHESLRTVFPEHEGTPYQQVTPAGPVELLRTVLGGDPDEAAARLDEALAAEAEHVFDLAAESLVRLRLFVLDERTHVLSVLTHHMVTDRESCRVFIEDLTVAYRARLNGASPSWPELALQFADFAVWQRNTFDHAPGGDDLSEYGKAQLDYWRATLADLPAEIAVAHDRPRPARLGHSGVSTSRVVPAETWRALRSLAEAAGVTEFMLCQAAAAVLLHALGGGDDVPIGATAANRAGASVDRLIGLFADMVVLRNDLSDDPTLRTVLERVRESSLSALGHQDVPFERIVESLNPPRVLGRNPLFQVIMQFGHSAPPIEFAGETIVTALTPRYDAAFLDFHLDFLVEADGELVVQVVVNSELYDPPSGVVFVDTLVRILTTFAAKPDMALGELNVVPEGWDTTRTVVRHAVSDVADVAAEAGPPRTETERTLVALLEELLEITDIDRTDGFFALGGDSVIAIQWAARAGAAGLALTPQMVFEHFTITTLAEAVDAAGADRAAAPSHADLRHAPMSASGLSDDALARLRESWSAQG